MLNYNVQHVILAKAEPHHHVGNDVADAKIASKTSENWCNINRLSGWAESSQNLGTLMCKINMSLSWANLHVKRARNLEKWYVILICHQAELYLGQSSWKWVPSDSFDPCGPGPNVTLRNSSMSPTASFDTCIHWFWNWFRRHGGKEKMMHWDLV